MAHAWTGLFSEALQGRKHWLVCATYRLDKDLSSRRWMEDAYPNPLSFGPTTVTSNNQKPYECTCKSIYKIVHLLNH
jgi:hypothetical protein